MNEFVNWTLLGTFAGLVAVVGVVTEFIKNVPYIKTVPTQLVSFVIALVMIVLFKLATGAFVWIDFTLDLVNAMVASLAANGGYDVVKRFFVKEQPSDEI